MSGALVGGSTADFPESALLGVSVSCVTQHHISLLRKEEVRISPDHWGAPGLREKHGLTHVWGTCRCLPPSPKSRHTLSTVCHSRLCGASWGISVGLWSPLARDIICCSESQEWMVAAPPALPALGIQAAVYHTSKGM